MNYRKNIKNNIQKYRVWKNLLQSELAEQTGVSVSEVRLLEKNKVSPHKATEEKLLKFFGISYHQLFYEEE